MVEPDLRRRGVQRRRPRLPFVGRARQQDVVALGAEALVGEGDEDRASVRRRRRDVGGAERSALLEERVRGVDRAWTRPRLAAVAGSDRLVAAEEGEGPGLG